MINLEMCLLKVLKFFKKTNANKKRSIKTFVKKILHLKPINNKKQVVKQNTDEFKYEGEKRTSDVEEIENETEGGGGDDDDDDDDDDEMMVNLMRMVMMMYDVEIDDDYNGDNDDDGDSGDIGGDIYTLYNNTRIE